MAQLVTKASIPKKSDDDSDSDEDIPISELLKRSAQQASISTASQNASKKPTLADIRKTPSAGGNNSSTRTVIKKESTPKSTPKAKSQSSSSSSSSKSPGVSIRMNTSNDSSDFYENTMKGFLLQSFLCRWWYATQWPSNVGKIVVVC